MNKQTIIVIDWEVKDRTTTCQITVNGAKPKPPVQTMILNHLLEKFKYKGVRVL